jgi:hypothetical protein
VTRPEAGTIVVVDWRGGALPKEPGRQRAAVVVEDTELFPPAYPNLLVVPLTRDEGLAHQSLAELIEPTAANGITERCWALSHHVTSVSLQRVEATASCVTAGQLASIRQRIALSIGVVT